MSSINADNGVISGITGVRTTADNSGNLALQANGVTLLTVATNNTIVLGNTLKFADGSTANTAASGGGPGAFQAIQTANFTATANNIYAVNTAAASVYVALPASPSVGQYVTFIDFARTFATNNLVITPNGSLVEGISNNSTIGVNGAAVSAVYSGSVQGWLQYSGVSTPQIGGYAANYLVAGGGGAGATPAGFTGGTGAGGGAGGYLTGVTTLVPGATYTMTVGAGGSGITSTVYYSGNSGSNSSMVGSTINILSIGGGGGGCYSDGNTGRNGGSGGGAGYGQTGGPGSGTTGQGNAGGNCTNSAPYGSGGGGGATQVGFDGGSVSGNGGNGASSTISGTAVYYCGGGGGGGGSGYATAGSGGLGGGGNGAAFQNNGGSGTANRGGGGGSSGSASGVTVTGGSGGSGVIIISYQGSQRGSGGTVTSSGGYTIHTFTSSGTYTA